MSNEDESDLLQNIFNMVKTKMDQEQPVEKPKKTRKPKPPLSEEQKERLREQLKRGRETSLAKDNKVRKRLNKK